VHGYSRSFHFKFSAHNADKCGFIVDFGELKWLKDHLDYMFDHTLLLMEDDPLLPVFQQIEQSGGAAIRLMPYGVGMEGTAEYLCRYADTWLRETTKGRCWVDSVESRENDKNSAIYYNPNAGFREWL
jgi:6-pyruvoyltetrahydropterin/6-carboxytetrahydropterin synthase